jgi:uncharacterized protein YjbI with pentapeptide repeats
VDRDSYDIQAIRRRWDTPLGRAVLISTLQAIRSGKSDWELSRGLPLADGVFRQYDLRGAPLNRMNLDSLDFRLAVLYDADFSGSTLVEADFSGTELIDAKFCDCDLTRCRFVDCLMPSVDFTSANMTQADLSDAILTHSILTNAILHGTNLDRASMRGVNLTNVNVSWASTIGTQFGDFAL